MLSSFAESRSMVPEDAPRIARIMHDAQASLDDSSMYIINTENRILQRIETKAIGTALTVHDMLVAFAFFQPNKR